MSYRWLLDDPVAQILSDLYAGGLDEAAWNRALLGIADLVRAADGLLLAFNPTTGQVLRAEQRRLDPLILDQYCRHWVYQDPRLPHFQDFPLYRARTERMLPLVAWQRSAILNEFLLPFDAPYFMPAWLYKSDSKVVALSMQGTRQRGPFEPHDLEIFEPLLPHIQRALEIRDRLERAQVQAQTINATLDRVNFGVAILDSSGKLLEANAILQQLLRTDSGITRKLDGTLSLRGPAGTQFAHWIFKGIPPAGNTDGLLHVPRLRALPLSVMISPLPPRTSSWIGGDPRWLVLIFDPERRVQASTDLIARDLSISSREAEIASLLVSGYTLRDAARRHEVSEHTVRSQLRSIFRKTGLQSQAELIRRVALGPAALGPDALTVPGSVTAAASGT